MGGLGQHARGGRVAAKAGVFQGESGTTEKQDEYPYSRNQLSEGLCRDFMTTEKETTTEENH